MSATMNVPASGGGPPDIDEYYRGGDDDHDKDDGPQNKPPSPFKLWLVAAALCIIALLKACS